MNFWLLSPELSICGIALAVILLDLVIKQKAALAAVSVFGLIIPLAFTIALWGEQQTSFSGMLVSDNFSLFFKFLIIGIAILVIISSIDYAKKFTRFQGEYYALILLSAGGLMLMASTGELISIYISLELASISLYALVAFLKDKSLEEKERFLKIIEDFERSSIENHYDINKELSFDVKKGFDILFKHDLFRKLGLDFDTLLEQKDSDTDGEFLKNKEIFEKRIMETGGYYEQDIERFLRTLPSLANEEVPHLARRIHSRATNQFLAPPVHVYRNVIAELINLGILIDADGGSEPKHRHSTPSCLHEATNPKQHEEHMRQRITRGRPQGAGQQRATGTWR